jgi:DNA-binding GntR family transcriptional regulator
MQDSSKIQKSNSTTSYPKSDALLSFFEEATLLPGPKRIRLHRAMLKMIEQGFWDPGDRLPTDVELTSKLPLSIATVQASLKMLAEQGLITRAKRLGSFVASEEHLPRDYFYFQFINTKTEARLAIKAVDLTIQEITEKGSWSKFLGQREKYLKVSRVICIGSAFRIQSDFYFANPKVWILMEIPVERLKDLAIQQLIHIRLGLPALKRDWAVSFAELDSIAANKIGVETGTQCQQFDVRVFTEGDIPLVFHRFVVPPNDYSLYIAS